MFKAKLCWLSSLKSWCVVVRLPDIKVPKGLINKFECKNLISNVGKVLRDFNSLPNDLNFLEKDYIVKSDINLVFRVQDLDSKKYLTNEGVKEIIKNPYNFSLVYLTTPELNSLIELDYGFVTYEIPDTLEEVLDDVTYNECKRGVSFTSREEIKKQLARLMEYTKWINNNG